MANLTQGTRPQPYGVGGRKVYLPVKANTNLFEGGMVAYLGGAIVPGTTAGAGNCVGLSEENAVGGASDGATRASVWTDKIFIFANGANALTDATPIGALVYMEDDHTVGTGGLGGSGEGAAGLFMGMEDDGRVRVWLSPQFASGAFPGNNGIQTGGAALANTAAQTVQAIGRSARYLMAAMGQNSTVTLGTVGAVVGDAIKILRTDTSAFTLAVANGGVGAGTIVTLDASKAGFAQAYFDGTNWQFDGAGIA